MIKMLKWILIIMVILVAGVIILVWKSQKKKKALLLNQKQSQKITDEAFTAAVQQVSIISFEKPIKLHSEFVSNIWGSKVTAFEYSIEIPQIETQDLAKIKKELTKRLQTYANEKHLVAYDNHPVFVVSDIWIFAGVLHVDVSHITNAETWSYVEDVTKSDRTN